MEPESRRTLKPTKTAADVIRHALANDGNIDLEDFRYLYNTDYGRQPIGDKQTPLEKILEGARMVYIDVKIPIEELQAAFPDIKVEPKPQLHNAPIRADFFDGTLNGYQLAAQSTAIYPGKGTQMGLIYTMLKGAGEIGEQCEKLGKVLRDKGGVISEEQRLDFVKELGDELWYIAARANELGVTLFEVADANIRKLQDRQKRGTLSGSGDNR